MEDKELKKLVNQILARKGLGPVKNLASEFSDGSKFLSSDQEFFSFILASFQHSKWGVS